MSETKHRPPLRRIPALVVSGFLGSGKTTLVRHLLDCAKRDGSKIAVVSNEFGELGIDAAMIAASTENYVELEGGCVCCKLGDELVETLQMLFEKTTPDRIVVETSGVALPYETLIHFWREPVRRWIGDEASIVVVDAEQVAENRDLSGTFEDQVSSADLLLLNKLDRIDPSMIETIERRLREMEPDAPILHSQFGKIDPTVLFPPDPAGERVARRDAEPPPPHSHEEFFAEEVHVETGIDPQVCEARLSALGALRVKGYVASSDGPRLVQGVGRRVTLSVPEEIPRAELLGRVVVIRRRNLPAHE